MTLQQFLSMGGYAFYVWMSYGIAAVVLAWNVVVPIWQSKQFFRQQALKHQRKQP